MYWYAFIIYMYVHIYIYVYMQTCESKEQGPCAPLHIYSVHSMHRANLPKREPAWSEQKDDEMLTLNSMLMQYIAEGCRMRLPAVIQKPPWR